MNDFADRAARFRTLHADGCFLLPNPWDAGGARRLEAMGFKALATSSAAIAWGLGRSDYGISLEESLANIALIANASTLPVNADFEGGFSDDPDQIGRNVLAAVEAGAAGISIEDRPFGSTDPQALRELDHAVACVKGARAALDEAGSQAMLVARCEAFLAGRKDLDFAIERLLAFAEAGADCLYAPGIETLDQIAKVVEAAGPLPVNVLLWGDAFTPAQAAQTGVRRLSTGGALAGAAWKGFDAAAEQLKAALTQ